MRRMKYPLLALALLMASATSAKRVVVPVYMFGYAASFSDSVVYLTDVQEVDSAWIDGKTRFLLGRDNYSAQLREHFTEKQMPNRVCGVIFALKRSDAEKMYLKMTRRYTVKAKNKYEVKYLTANDFKFQSINMAEEEDEAAPKPVKKPKKPKGPKPPKGQQGQLPPKP
ncbi:MAG: hypothetical protein IJ710_07610 [Prevotella sp.]|nr:hypothetical protein [Prevotella sp.]